MRCLMAVVVERVEKCLSLKSRVINVADGRFEVCRRRWVFKL